MKTYIHLKSEVDAWDPKVCIIKDLEVVPNKKDYIYLTIDDKEILVKQIIEQIIDQLLNNTFEALENYSGYLYGRLSHLANDERGKEKLIEEIRKYPDDIDVDDCIVVTSRCFDFKDNTFHIEIGIK